MDIVSIGIFSLALMLAAGSPGPSIAALVARVIARGWHDVVPFLAAMWIGEIIWLSFALTGLTALAQTFHAVFVLLKYLGVGYLLYLAWRMWRAPVVAESAGLPVRGSGVKMFAAGMAVTLGNPKIMIFYVALLPSLIDLSQVSVQLWAVLAVVAVLSLAVVDLTWVALAHRARSLLKTPRAMRAANRMGAVTLAGAAALISGK